MKIANYVGMGLSFAISMQVCFGANVTVVIANTPKNADSVLIAVDGHGSAAPLVQAIKPNTNGGAIVSITLDGPTNKRFRAIAIRHHGTSIFPFITAVTAVEPKGKVDVVQLRFRKSASIHNNRPNG